MRMKPLQPLGVVHARLARLAKFVDLYRNVDNAEHRCRFEKFERWCEYTVNLPGTLYLQVITQPSKENRFAKGTFVGLARDLQGNDL